MYKEKYRTCKAEGTGQDTVARMGGWAALVLPVSPSPLSVVVMLAVAVA